MRIRGGVVRAQSLLPQGVQDPVPIPVAGLSLIRLELRRGEQRQLVAHGQVTALPESGEGGQIMGGHGDQRFAGILRGLAKTVVLVPAVMPGSRCSSG